MKFIQKHIRVLHGFVSIFVAFGILFTGGLQIALTFRNDLDARLGTTSSVVVSEETGEAKYTSEYADTASLVQANIDLSERIESEGAVLLKNNNGSLPLESTKVTLFGTHSYTLRYGGTVNARPELSQCIPVAQAFNERGFTVNPQMVEFYKGLSSTYPQGKASSSYEGAYVNEAPRSEYANAPTNYADYSDAAIIFLGRDSAEGGDYYPGADGIAKPGEFDTSDTGNIFSLSDEEKDLIAYVKEQGVFDTIIVCLNTISTMEIQSLKEDEDIDAILWIGNPGAYGIYGVADIIAGKVSPSGKLPDTYAVNTAKAPAAMNYGVYTYTNYLDLDETAANGNYWELNSWYVAYLEGIYTGYKYYETRYYDSVVNEDSGAASATGSSIDGAWNYDTEVSYPFGYGLSYTTFEEEIVEANINLNGDSTFKVKVTNTGSVTSKHVVQLYVSLPWQVGQVEKSAIQLVGYAKTGDREEKEKNLGINEPVYLKPGESETLTIVVPNAYFASYDENEGNGAYILDSGNYFFAVGNGAHEALQNVMRADGKLDDGVDTSKTVVSAQNAAKIVIDRTANGTEIENQLKDTADLSSYGVEVTYLSRSDWENTFPETLVLEANEAMQYYLKNDTYDGTEDMPAHTFGIAGVAGSTPITALVGLEYDDPTFDAVISAIPIENIVDSLAKGFQIIKAVPEISMPAVHANGVTIGQGATLGKYTEKGSAYYVKPKDENITYSCNVFPLEAVVAATFSHRLAELEGKLIGNQSLWTGLQWWYGVGSNLHRSPYNARNHDYYSEDPILSGVMGMDLAVAAEPYGTIVGMKHFAFNNMESHRMGVSTYFNEQSARENELRSFQFAVESGAVGSIMTAYNRVGATMSAANADFITGILREEWGYKGIVITDLIQSANGYYLPREILTAGTDVIMTSSASWDTFSVSSVSADPVMQDAVYNAWHHILYTVANSNVLNTMSESSTVVRIYPWWEIALIAGTATSWALTAVTVSVVAVGSLRKKKEA